MTEEDARLARILLGMAMVTLTAMLIILVVKMIVSS